MGVVGPITDRCVCIARARDLLALDPLTGATLWTWHGLPQGAEVFGDNDAVIIAPPDGSEHDSHPPQVVWCEPPMAN